MSKTTSTSKPPIPLRLLTANYIGGLGYYYLLVVFAIWMVGLFTHVRQYIIYEVVHVVPDAITAHTASNLTNNAGDVSRIFAEVFSFVVVVACLLIVVVLPYYIGMYASRLSNGLLYMIGREQTLKHLSSLKQTTCAFLIGAFILTTYDFSKDANANAYSFGLIGTIIAVMALFWLQYALVKWWNLQKQHIF